MEKIYKVTNTKITKSKNGYTISNIELNNKVWVSALSKYVNPPKRNRDKLTVDDIFQYGDLLYEEELNSLIGKFITISLEKDMYGMKIEHISSYDSIKEFKNLLDSSDKKAFETNLPIYDFLKSQNYPINFDGSITLKSPYNYFKIKDSFKGTICYPNNLKGDQLTFDNITLIYEKFYKNKKARETETRSCKYQIKTTGIVEYCQRYSKHMGKPQGSHESFILKIGDKLSKEHIEYLNGLKEELKSE